MRLLRVLGCLALLPLACGEDDPSSPKGDEPSAGADGAAGAAGSQGDAGAASVPAGPQVIGPEGGTVKSDDGLATLTIPEGALEEPTEIQLRPVEPEDNPALARDATQLAGYELLPDGLTFEEPATLSVRLSELVTVEGEDAIVPVVLATTFSERTLEVLTDPGLSIDLDSGEGTADVSLSHFSHFAFEAFPPTNELGTPYFHFRLEPMPPAEAELGHDYGIGLRFSVKSTLEQDVGMTYTDHSKGLSYSGGAKPVRVSGFVADTPVEELFAAGSYSCDELGKATYSALLQFDEFLWEPFPPPDYCTSEDPCTLADQGPQNYWVRLGRDVSCVEAKEPATPEGPYSGLVQFEILWDQGNQLNFDGYFPGSDQAAFDAWVAKRHARYGIRPDRLPSGTCREVAYEEAGWDLPPGARQLESATKIGLDFIGQGKPLYAADWLGAQLPFYRGSLAFIPEVAPEGLGVHLPFDAPSPAITLPGWDYERRDIKWTPGSIGLATEGVTVSWGADTITADFIHVEIVGFDEVLPPVAYECFAEIDDQLLLIPQDIVEPVREHASYSFKVRLAKRTTAAYEGKTLDGLFLRTFGNSQVPPPE